MRRILTVLCAVLVLGTAGCADSDDLSLDGDSPSDDSSNTDSEDDTDDDTDDDSGGGIVNGDFEAGTEGWAGAEGLVVPGQGEINSSTILQMAGIGEEGTQSVTQTFVVPDDATELTFSYEVESLDGVADVYDSLTMTLDGDEVLSLSNQEPTDGEYRDGSADLSGLAGEEVVLELVAEEDVSLQTWFRFDDFAVT